MELNSSVEQYEFADIPKRVLRFFNLWPKNDNVADVDLEDSETTEPPKYFWKNFKIYLFFWSLLPTTIPLLYDIIALLMEEDSDILEVLQPLLAFCCIVGHHYLAVCCLYNVTLMVKILSHIERMKYFRPIDEIIEVDRKARWFTKLLLIYSTIGSVSYSLMPLLPTAVRDCKNNLTPSMIKHGIPCGLPCRVRIPFSAYINNHVLKFVWVLMYLHQIYLIFCVTCLFITLTMLLCSAVMQCVYHFKALRTLILSIDDKQGDHTLLIKCIFYHSSIISLCQDVNEAFGTQMTMFIVLPSFAISLLGFELLIVGFTEGIRFGLHLVGWIALLLLVNYGGQILMDESIGVAETAYAIKWYEYEVPFQKDLYMVIMRSQKPVFLNASNIRNLSFETFLKVISSAYSYLTMLINMKMN